MNDPMDAIIWKPTGVSFSSGGVHTVGQLGALSKLLDTGILDNVRNWYGCSGGSFAALLGIIGVSPAWIRDASQHMDTCLLGEIEEDCITNYLNCWGITSGKKLVALIGRIIDTWEPGSSAWTFADLSANRPGITLNITATNLTRQCLTVFNAANSPDIAILDAVRASCAVPCFYTPWTSPQGEMFCDGGILENYPWACVDDKKKTLVIVCSDTGISKRAVKHSAVKTFPEYIGLLSKLLQSQTPDVFPTYWIAINTTCVGSLDFHMTKEERLAVFDEGVVAASRWLDFGLSLSLSLSLSKKKAAAGETRGNRLHFGDRRTLSAWTHDPSRRSDSHPEHSLQPPPCPSPDLCSGDRPRGRRWSL